MIHRLVQAIHRRHAQADARARAAQAEVKRSQRRLDAVRSDVVRPLQAAAASNRFADLIRASLEGDRR